MHGLTLETFFSFQNDFSDDFVFLPALPNCSEWELHPTLCVPILSFYLQHALASCCSVLDDTFFMRISSQRIEFSFLLFFLFLRVLSGSQNMPSFFFHPGLSLASLRILSQLVLLPMSHASFEFLFVICNFSFPSTHFISPSSLCSSWLWLSGCL